MQSIFLPVLAVAVLLLSVSVMVPVAQWLRLPHTVLLAAFGILVGALSLSLAGSGETGVAGDLLGGLRLLGIPAEAFLVIFLPPLLFAAGLGFDVRRLLDEFAAVLLLAVVAVVVCTLVVGVALAPFTPLGLLPCLLLGSIIATTDPAAVVGIFRDIGAPRRLSVLVEGESVFNDAAAIALFGILLGMLVGGQEPDFGAAATTFLTSFAGGVALGFLAARLFCGLLPRFGGSLAAEMTATIALAYLVFIAGDRYLGVSGVVAVATAALTVAAFGPLRLAPSSWRSLVEGWGKIEFWANSLIVVMATMLAAKIMWQLALRDAAMLAALIVAALSARALVLYGLLPGLTALRLIQPIDGRYKVVILWGGLRGALTMVLALAVSSNAALPAEVRHFVSVVAIGLVLFTLFVTAPTLRPLLRLLGLDRLDPVELAMRNRVMALSRTALREEVAKVGREFGLDPALVRRVVGDDVLPQPDAAEPALSDDVRLQVGLLTLANREKEFYLAHFDERIVSRQITSLLVAAADDLGDAVKSGGADGFAHAAHRAAEISWRLRLGLWCHRRLGWSGLLAEALADRFEGLLIQRLVLRELREFNARAVRPVLGPATSAALDALLAARLESVSQALAALELQYPRYAEALGAQYLGRAALRIEDEDYRAKAQEALISREVFNDLQRDLQARREAVERRPPLDLGLKLAEMVRRVPIFATLDAARLEAVARMLRPMLATPGERIVVRGQRGDAMYFIAAGAVEVVLPHERVRLEAGDFFGELALLLDQARSADVVATGFCHLLMLKSADFRRLLRASPELKDEIEAIARRRLASNAPGEQAAE